MSRKFIATILAASLAITGFSTAPAQAGNDDLAKFLAGAAALVIIGSAIDDNKNRKVVTRRYDDNRYYGTTNQHQHRYQHQYERRSAPLPRYDDKRYNDRGRNQAKSRDHRPSGANDRHAARTHPRARALPEQCRLPGRGKAAYSAKCLNRYGYRADRQ
ncbi:hypothetical protein [Thalassovita taeanensis]|uniref:Uncharacterized protein n=1 Tax=Thalassovita taeanensis TaxID=657014 RepID=A0A1H9CI87_9RHOB|nr:hypothetical protein [Thalassovita taeanensis]SEQ00889.1 hypothetical protein SAMN04488092_103269 [Thalassovita taeanensis]